MQRIAALVLDLPMQLGELADRFLAVLPAFLRRLTTRCNRLSFFKRRLRWRGLAITVSIGEGGQLLHPQINADHRTGVLGTVCSCSTCRLTYQCPACSLTVAERIFTPQVGRYSRSLSRSRPSRGSTIALSDTTMRPVSRKLPSPFFLVLNCG